MRKSFIIFLFFISACGYQPIFKSNDPNNFIFKKIELIGDTDINRKIVSALSLKEKSTDNTLNEIFIESSKEVISASKNSKGQVTSFKSTVNLIVTIKFKDEILKNKIFIKNFSYDNSENKFKLAEYQNQVQNNLTEKIIEELIIFLNL
mgnify:CR=1 FL=1|tara:strand:- start:147 stop:593 length:447 start_codon:yes stop_codon:yes gene_type:complete